MNDNLVNSKKAGKRKNAGAAKQALSEKILLHLADCMDFGFSYSFNKKFGHPQFPGKILRNLIKDDNKNFGESITDLKKFKFIEKKRNYDGSILITLTDKGRLRALNLRFKRLDNKKENWDGKWRMVAFDIPNECKKGRNALRYRLKSAGFYEFQESLFLYPYDCEREIKDFIKLFKLEKYVCFATIDRIDTDKNLKFRWKLL